MPFYRTLACLRTLVIAVVVLGAPLLHAQPRPALSPDAEAVYRRWLTTTCVGDEARALADQIRGHAAELAPAFARAMTAGPPPEQLRVARAAAETRYDARAKFPLGDYAVGGVNAEDLARFRRVSREDFVNDQLRRYALGYRANAIAALGILGDVPSRALLARIAGNLRNPLAPAAREALRQAGRPR